MGGEKSFIKNIFEESESDRQRERVEIEKQMIFSSLTPSLRGFKVHQYLFFLLSRS